MVAMKRGAADTNGSGASSSKKARTNTHRDAQALMSAILAKPETYPILDDEDAVRRQFVQLARYTRDLEGDVQSASQPGRAPKTMTSEQLQAAVEKLRKAVNSGIKKQMAVCRFHI